MVFLNHTIASTRAFTTTASEMSMKLTGFMMY